MRTGEVQPLDAVFAKIKVRFDERSRNGLICKQGSYKACSVLKLQKPSWTNGRTTQWIGWKTRQESSFPYGRMKR
jgi:hypothetical protein